MRRSTLSAFVLIAMNAGAQDWALLNPAYKYNYSNDGTDTISNQIFITGIDTLGPDSFLYQLNRIARYCSECLPDCNLEIDEPQFLMRGCEVSAGGWKFLDTSTYIINPGEPMGTSWLFAPDIGRVGTIVATAQTIVFGNPDSTKTLATAEGDTVVWSKLFGILRWRVGTGSALQLIGVHGPQVGSLIPSLADFYPYQAGDVVQYHSGSWSNSTSFGRYRQYHITGRADYPDSIVFTATQLWAFVPDYGPWIYGSDNAYLKVAASSAFMSAVHSYPGQFIYNDFDATGMIVTHGLNSAGMYEIRNVPNPDLPLIEVFQDTNSACFTVQPLGTSQSHWIMDAQVGLRGYLVNQLIQGNYFHWEGALINGVQIGTLGSAEFFHVGIDESRTSNVVQVFPNPASDNVTIASALELGPWVISDALGRVVLSGNAGGRSSVEVSVLEIPVAAYLLHVFSPTGVVSKRLMVVR